MKNKISLIILCVVSGILILFQTSIGYCSGPKEQKYVPNEVLVRFHDGVDESQKDAVRESLNAVLVKVIKSIRVEYWKLPKNVSTEEALEILKSNPSIEHAEPNYLSKPHAVPNDPQFKRLWFLRNNGQSVNSIVGTPGADIKAVKAWDIETGKNNVVIAVIDWGVAFDHPDLKNNIWKNTGEISNNEIDDDNNGYVDDVQGWDFVNDDNNPSEYIKDVFDIGHGTHVAGIIAAKGNNGVGITGVMWNAKIMALQTEGYASSNLSAIEYAVNNGAKIINCSMGNYSFDQFEYNACQYANENGVLFVASAGNDKQNNDIVNHYPSGYDLPNIISVAATDQNDQLAASYSNYGRKTVDVAAPGGGHIDNIYSTIALEREILFYDNFESGLGLWSAFGRSRISLGDQQVFKLWTTAYSPTFGSYVLIDSEGNYYNFEETYLTTINKIYATNYRDVCFKFDILYWLEAGYDGIYLELSENGYDFTPVDLWTGVYDGIEPYLLCTDNQFGFGDFYFRFHLSTSNSGTADGAYIDNVLVTGIPLEFNGDEYGYQSGTSMAAPVVSGIAGLVWSHYPALTHIQVKEIILNSVDKLPSLDGKVLSGGRVNAYKTLLPQLNAPSLLNCKATSSTQIVLGWKDNSENESGFKIERKAGACNSSNKWVTIATKPANATTHIISGLSPNTSYVFRVRAYQGSTNSSYSNCATSKTGLPGAPPAPTNLKAASVSSTKINLSWSDNSANESGFKIFRKIETSTWSLLKTTGAEVKNISDTAAPGNASATIYQYYICAYNDSGKSPSSNTAIVPYKPTNLSAIPGSSSSSIKLTWSDKSNNETGFEIYRKAGVCKSANAWKLIKTVGANIKTWTNTGLNSGNKYSYQVRAMNRSTAQPTSYGYSMYSNCSTATAP
jgi:subtilisin family serine protease